MAKSHVWVANSASGAFILDPANYVDGTAFRPGDTLVINGGNPGASAITLGSGTFDFNDPALGAESLNFTNVVLDAQSTIQVTGPQALPWVAKDQFINDGLVQVGTVAQSGHVTYSQATTGGSAYSQFTNNGYVEVQNSSSFSAPDTPAGNTLTNAAGALIRLTNGGIFAWAPGYGLANANVVNNGSIVLQGGAGPETALIVGGALTGTGVLSVQGVAGHATNTDVTVYGSLNSTVDLRAAALSVFANPTGGSINFLDGNGVLGLEGGSSFANPGLPTASYAPFGATIAGFRAGDVIKFDLPVSVQAFSYDPATHTLSVTAADGSTQLALVFAGTYAQSDFQVAAGASGTGAVITTTSTANTAMAHVPPPVTPTVAGEDPIFDTAYYLAENPDVAAAGVDPYQHFLTNGWHEGRNPSASFDTRDYLATYPDVAAAGLDPLLHYEVFGQAEGRSAFAVGTVTDPLVDPVYYYAHNPDVVAAGLDAATHYDTYGWHDGRNPDSFFDTQYYLAQNPDVAASGMDPLTHYELYGWHDGRDPSLLFSTSGYLAANPDVARAGLDPLVHFLQHGEAEGRPAPLAGGTAAADPLVDAAYYDRQLGATLLPSGLAAAGQAAASYELTGWPRGLNPDAFFNTSYYLAQNPDVAAAHLDPLAHYEQFGWHEGRDPSASFSTSKYLAAYGDVRAAGLDPLAHFLQYGQAEGRTAFLV